MTDTQTEPSELFTDEAMRSAPTPLVLARRRLAELQARYESILNEAEENGEYGDLEEAPEWKELRRQLKDAAGNVATEEIIEKGRLNS